MDPGWTHDHACWLSIGSGPTEARNAGVGAGRRHGPLMREYAGVRVMVVGASGFIGRWVARKLNEAGAQLHLLVRDPLSAARIFETRDIQGEAIAGDISSAAELE